MQFNKAIMSFSVERDELGLERALKGFLKKTPSMEIYEWYLNKWKFSVELGSTWYCHWQFEHL